MRRFSMKGGLDPQLWHACAGGMVQMPQLNTNVFYFPQGHAEHANINIDFITLPSLILCKVVNLFFMADPETDEVYAKLKLLPLRNSELVYDDDDEEEGGDDDPSSEKPASFAKTLTQSDANNGGGFSVPRYCAETIFPRLDYAAEPPVQTVVAKDVHGELWKFRHIYRGTPRRHLLTTGWSSFVNQKKLVAGDSVVFLRAENGELCVGIRRAKKGICVGGGGGSSEASSCGGGWSSSASSIGNCGIGSYGGAFSFFLKEENNKSLRNGNLIGRGTKVRSEAVVEAVTLAANNQPFEVVYYPRANTPEFCIKASLVRAAMRIQWCPGMRFKMPFETEDSSRISWFMGTISSVLVLDPIRWPNSPWRLLQVTWDEPDLLQNVKRVSPWLVELVSNMPLMHFSPLTPPPRKKMRFPPQHPLDVQFSGNQLGQNLNSPLFGLSDNAPAGIQGARHAQIGGAISLSDLNLKLHSGISNGNFMTNHDNSKTKESLSCWLTIGKSDKNLEKSNHVKTKHQFLLFGQPILTEQQISLDEENKYKQKNFLDSPVKASSAAKFSWQLGLNTAHCKVFLESEDVGRTLDLSCLGSYEELYRTLANMFGLERSEMLNHVFYCDATGAVKKTGEEPFSDFMKTAKRLTILMDSGNKNIRGAWITGTHKGEHGLDASSNKTGPLSIFA